MNVKECLVKEKKKTCLIDFTENIHVCFVVVGGGGGGGGGGGVCVFLYLFSISNKKIG